MKIQRELGDDHEEEHWDEPGSDLGCWIGYDLENDFGTDHENDLESDLETDHESDSGTDLETGL